MARCTWLGVPLLMMLSLTGCLGGPQSAKYVLAIQIQGEGSVTPASGTRYPRGTVVELTPTAKIGWVFNLWGGPDGSAVVLEGGKYKLAMTKNRTIIAQFLRQQHSITVTAVPEEAGKVEMATVTPANAASADVDHGLTIRLTALANPGYAFDHWEGDLTGSTNPITLTADEDKQIVAVFIPVISGRVVGNSSGIGLAGVRVDCGGESVVTDTQGYYVFKGASGTVTVIPRAPAGAMGVVTNPSSITITAPKGEADFAMSWVEFSDAWGGSGQSAGKFDYPAGVAVDNAGYVYVVDRRNNRVQKFRSGAGTTATYVGEWGSPGSGEGEFNLPHGIAVDSLGSIYVADTENHRVQKFTPDGTFIGTWGSLGEEDGQFNVVLGVAVDRAGNVYVADFNNARIQKFTSDGAFLTQWGGVGKGTLIPGPIGIAVDSNSGVYVADNGGLTGIKKFTDSGVLLTEWGSWGSGVGQFDNPFGVAVDSFGNVYVADVFNYRVQKFTSTGVFVTAWQVGASGSSNPNWVAVDSAGSVYVTERWSNLVRKFTQVQ